MSEPIGEPDCRRKAGCRWEPDCFDGICDGADPVERWPDGQPVNPTLTQEPVDFGRPGDEPDFRPRPDPGA